MKLRSLLLSALCAVAVTAGFTSCSDDDEDWNPSKEGSKINMVETRAFILNEGSYNGNNAGITYFDWRQDTTYINDLYFAQNGKSLGDTGQDIIKSGNNIYVVMYGSNYIAKLNSVGVEQGRLSFNSTVGQKVGQPRYAVEDNGYLYVTCYGGYVVKVNTTTMVAVDTVKVGSNPEYIVKHNGNIYCTNSGWGSDNRVAKISIDTFKKAEFFNVMYNPDHILEVNNRIFVQGYGTAYDYPWGELNISTGEFKEIGHCSSWAAYNDVIYMVNSVTDWNTNTTTNSFKTYDTKTNALATWNIKNIPAGLTNTSVSSICVNEKTGDIYIMTSDYVNNGSVYHVKADGTYVGIFKTTGITPRKIVFFD